MSKRKTGAIPVNAPKEKKKMVIDMNRANLAKSYQQPGFRTGRHMTEKDRPRKKNWKKDYYGDPGTGSFSYCIFLNSIYKAEYYMKSISLRRLMFFIATKEVTREAVKANKLMKESEMEEIK